MRLLVLITTRGMSSCFAVAFLFASTDEFIIDVCLSCLANIANRGKICSTPRKRKICSVLGHHANWKCAEVKLLIYSTNVLVELLNTEVDNVQPTDNQLEATVFHSCSCGYFLLLHDNVRNSSSRYFQSVVLEVITIESSRRIGSKL